MSIRGSGMLLSGGGMALARVRVEIDWPVAGMIVEKIVGSVIETEGLPLQCGQ